MCMYVHACMCARMHMHACMCLHVRVRVCAHRHLSAAACARSRMPANVFACVGYFHLIHSYVPVLSLSPDVV